MHVFEHATPPPRLAGMPLASLPVLHLCRSTCSICHLLMRQSIIPICDVQLPDSRKSCCTSVPIHGRPALLQGICLAVGVAALDSHSALEHEWLAEEHNQAKADAALRHEMTATTSDRHAALMDLFAPHKDPNQPQVSEPPGRWAWCLCRRQCHRVSHTTMFGLPPHFYTTVLPQIIDHHLVACAACTSRPQR